ncbi:MAG: FtsX-like permease family protein, partial [Candidatus Marinimicrobia bacterium]|nr:FtsX-like permease family protein [Candidatus Neomarinimicrobiota bacterium]
NLNEYVTSFDFYAAFAQAGNQYAFHFQPLEQIHLHSSLPYELEPNGNITYVHIFGIIGLIILLLACINFVNLATARAIKRSREVGIRKALGSGRGQLIRQFLLEAAVYVLIAASFAVLMAEFVLPYFNQLSDKQLAIQYLHNSKPLLLLGAIVVVMILGSGIYPALFLASFKPVRVLKSRFTSDKKASWLRNGLIVLQFCLSTGLIIGTITVQKQLKFIQTKNLGIQTESILIVESIQSLGDRHSAFRQQLEQQSQIISASVNRDVPFEHIDSQGFELEAPANMTQSSFNYLMVDEYFVETVGLNVVKGRDFDLSFGTDSTAYLINQAAVAAIGWEQPIGKLITSGVGEGPVIGVVEDFHYQSLHLDIEPLIMPYNVWKPLYVLVRFAPGNVYEGVEIVKSVWQDFQPNYPIQYAFFDQEYQAQYESEQQLAGLITSFSGLAIFLACLGLFGLTAYAAERRTKEIGIRKVMGSSELNILLLLIRDFLQMVLLSSLLAIPVTWFVIHHWLQNFAYHINPGAGLFLIAIGITAGVALIVVSAQSLTAALANPVDTLRNE